MKPCQKVDILEEKTTAMKCMIHLLLLLIVTSCRSQTETRTSRPSQVVGGPCEICDAIKGYDYESLQAVDTLPDFAQSTEPLKITGTVYQPDGKTPAAGVVLYIYQTNEKGEYQRPPGQNRPGAPTYHQGWVKTDANGQYTFYTFLPGAYPNGREARHIHPLIQEPDGKLYWIDAYLFDHDPLLKTEIRKQKENRGGSGILRLRKQGDLLVGRRDIILGLNIPGYAKTTGSVLASGQQIGEDVFSFTPQHVWGPDAGTKTCPVCKYGRYHGILFTVGNDQADWQDVANWLTYFEEVSHQRQEYLKVYMIYANKDSKSAEKQLRELGRKLDLERVALTFVPSFSDKASEVDLLGINPQAANTIILYRNSRIVDKYVDLIATKENFDLITTRLDETADDIFYLPAFGSGKE